ncbi:hypothetical protein ACVXHB_24485 [Escherichia coli]
MVGEEGHAWLSGVAENQKFTVVWGEQSSLFIFQNIWKTPQIA